jgi:hypothetical protein
MHRSRVIALIGLLFLTAPDGALAELGGTMDGVNQDAMREGGVAVSRERDQFTLITIATRDVTIREYLSESGRVFGVTWQGTRHPNTLLLLGTYVITPETPLLPGSIQQPRFSRRITSHVVVEAGGTVGEIWGRAYVPVMVPSGVSLEQIK